MTLPEVLLTRELAAIGMDRQLRNWFAEGHVRRIVPGAYARTLAWEALSTDDRYRLRVLAAALLFPREQFSHDSAAALWGLPSLGPWPALAHAVSSRAAGGRSGVHLARHTTGRDPNGTIIDGVPVTSLSRTLADVACMRSFGRAVGMVDAGLALIGAPTKDEIRDELMSLGPIPGFARGFAVVDFADSQSQSLGESHSRVQIRALRLPQPELQVEFFDAEGKIGDADFFWREQGVIGEFDGYSKYGDARRYSRHLSAQEVLIAEKAREDRLRRVVNGVVRWDWATALDRAALGRRLAEHGVVPSRPARRL